MSQEFPLKEIGEKLQFLFLTTELTLWRWRRLFGVKINNRKIIQNLVLSSLEMQIGFYSDSVVFAASSFFAFK